MKTNQIINGDCLEVMKTMSDNSVDLVLTDPPYNIGIDDWDAQKNINDYINWLNLIIKEIERVLKLNGSFYIFGNFNFIGEIKVLISKYDFKLISWIIWDKGSKEQNSTRTYADITEHLLFFVKGIKKDLDIPTEINMVRNYLREEKKKSGKTNKYFNKEFSKLYNKRGCKDRSVIEHYFSEKQWIFPSEEIYRQILQKTGFFKKDFKKLYQQYKNQRYTFNHEAIRIPRNPKDRRKFNYENQICPNVWYYNNKSEMAKIEHSTPKPIKLIETIIKASSNKNDLILDPFLGSGTTAVACKQLGRKYIGIEINPDYCKIAKERLRQDILDI